MNKTSIILLFAIISVVILLIYIIYLPNIETSKGYPKWLKDNGHFPDQISGITLIEKDNNGNKLFITVEDTKSVHKLIIDKNENISLFQFHLSEKAQQIYSKIKYVDWEDVEYDRLTGKIYAVNEAVIKVLKRKGVTITNQPGLYELIFNKKSLWDADTLISILYIPVEPYEEFTKDFKDNISYEGLAVDSKYFYFGFEGKESNELFFDSCYISIVDKNSFRIVKKIDLASSGIRTVTGLSSAGDLKLFGTDRNENQIFYISLNVDLEIEELYRFSASNKIPGYPKLRYVSAIESIAYDNEGFLYVADDPYRELYIPNDHILSLLDTNAVNNFNNFVPVLHKYKVKGRIP